MQTETQGEVVELDSPQSVKAIVLTNERTFVDVSSADVADLQRKLDVILVQDEDIKGDGVLHDRTDQSRRGILGLIEDVQMQRIRGKKAKKTISAQRIFDYPGMYDQLDDEAKGILAETLRIEGNNTKDSLVFDKDGLPLDFGKLSVRSRIEEIRDLLTIKRIPDGYVLLKPLFAGVCVSDVYYWLFEKSIKKLVERVPVVPLHEGVCKVVRSGNHCFYKRNTVVVPMPMQTDCDFLEYERKCSACQRGLRNLCTCARFMGSTDHGLARSYFLYPENLVIPIPYIIPMEVATVLEPLSTTYRAIHVGKVDKNMKIAIIGSGTFGLMIALMLAYGREIPKENLLFFGRSDKKLKAVKEFATPINMSKSDRESCSDAGDDEEDSGIWGRDLFKRLKEEKVDLVFECAGSNFMGQTIKWAMDIIKPGGTVIVLGLNDEPSDIVFSNLVNNGVTLRGVSRSKKEDYEAVVSMLKRRNSFLEKMENEGVELFEKKIKGAADLRDAFEWDQDRTRRDVSMKKVVVELDL